MPTIAAERTAPAPASRIRVAALTAALGIVLVSAVGYVAVSSVALRNMTAIFGATGEMQQRIVRAVDGLMDADQGVRRHAIVASAASLAHYQDGSRRFEREMRIVTQFAVDEHLAAMKHDADRASRLYLRWHSRFAERAAQGAFRDESSVRAADRLVDDTQDAMLELARTVARQGSAQIDAVQRDEIISQSVIGVALFVLAGIGFALDLKRRREQTVNLQVLNDRAAALERSNAALQDFAYVASHDLQEPLRMVSSYTQLLGRRYRGRLDADADDFIGYAVDGAKRMQTLIHDILAYSRISASEAALTAVDLDRVYQDAVGNLQETIAETDAALTATALPRVLGDAAQLRQLLQNLVGNALKYRSDAAPLVRVESKRDGAMVEIAVRDNGIGIAPEYFDRIFRMFQRLHGQSAYGGTGIGLAICKRIVERHGGSMRVESTPGRGSAFFVTLRAA